MKCPSCKYEDGWSPETLAFIKGDKGGFYVLPITVDRVEDDRVERKQLCGCPRCGTASIDLND